MHSLADSVATGPFAEANTDSKEGGSGDTSPPGAPLLRAAADAVLLLQAPLSPPTSSVSTPISPAASTHTIFFYLALTSDLQVGSRRRLSLVLFHALAVASAAADADITPDAADAMAAAAAAGQRAAGLIGLYRAALAAEIFASGGLSPVATGEIGKQEGLVLRSGLPARPITPCHQYSKFTICFLDFNFFYLICSSTCVHTRMPKLWCDWAASVCNHLFLLLRAGLANDTLMHTMDAAICESSLQRNHLPVSPVLLGRY